MDNRIDKLKELNIFKEKNFVPPVEEEPIINLRRYKQYENNLTVGMLKKLISDLPDDVEVVVGSEGGDYIVRCDENDLSLFYTHEVELNFDYEKNSYTNETKYLYII